VIQVAYEVPNFYTKINLMSLLLAEDETMSKVLVFVSTKKIADELFEQLQPDYPDNAGVIHSNKEQNHRFNTVRHFKSGTYKFIIATDIVARGIDVAEVTHVINFDVPEVPENYIHRIGRTGRADKKGIAISFVTPREMAQLDEIENFMKFKVPFEALPVHLQVSTELTEDEQPKVFMKEIQVKVPVKIERGASFHEKSLKNSKINNKISRKDLMKKKYGKPITRRGKR